MRLGFAHVGNATDFVEFRISPNYRLPASYTQRASKGTAFREAHISKVERVKQK